jgi:hypothetical protein
MAINDECVYLPNGHRQAVDIGLFGGRLAIKTFGSHPSRSAKLNRTTSRRIRRSTSNAIDSSRQSKVRNQSIMLVVHKNVDLTLADECRRL